MKRFLFISAFVLGMIVIFFACQQDSGVCKQCKMVQVDNTTNASIDLSPNQAYCGDSLNIVQNKQPVVVGNKTTKYSCSAK